MKPAIINTNENNSHSILVKGTKLTMLLRDTALLPLNLCDGILMSDLPMHIEFIVYGGEIEKLVVLAPRLSAWRNEGQCWAEFKFAHTETIHEPENSVRLATLGFRFKVPNAALLTQLYDLMEQIVFDRKYLHCSSFKITIGVDEEVEKQYQKMEREKNIVDRPIVNRW